MAFIYKITNKVNGKIYIGRTKNSLKARFKDHCSKNSACVAISNAIKKYGKESFKIEPLFEGSPEECNELEPLVIESLDSANKHVGYNIMTSEAGCITMSDQERKRRSDKARRSAPS